MQTGEFSGRVLEFAKKKDLKGLAQLLKSATSKSQVQVKSVEDFKIEVIIMTNGKQYYVCIGDGCHHHSAKKFPSYSRNRRQEATNFYFASAGWPRCIRKTVRLLARSSGRLGPQARSYCAPGYPVDWSFAEWPVAPVDEDGVHSGRFCPDAIEGVVGHEKNLVHADTFDCGGLGIRGHVRLEGV